MSPEDAAQPRLQWPEGYRAAATLTFDVDAESAVLAMDPTTANRLSVMTHQAYGPRVGVPRLLRMLGRHDVMATFFVPGYTAECWPDAVRMIREAGHEIGHHGYLHESLVGVDEAREVEFLERGLEALDRIAGVPPTGYRAPMWELRSPRLLAERGFTHDSSLMDGDAPYVLATGQEDGSTLVECPIQWALDDWERYAYIPGITGTGLIETPTNVVELWRQEAEALCAEGGHFILTNHPFLSGRPSRAAALESLVRWLKEVEGLWIAPLRDVAGHVAQLGLPPRLHPPLHGSS